MNALDDVDRHPAEQHRQDDVVGDPPALHDAPREEEEGDDREHAGPEGGGHGGAHVDERHRHDAGTEQPGRASRPQIVAGAGDTGKGRKMGSVPHGSILAWLGTR